MSFIIIVMLWLPPVVRVGGVSKVETFADSMPAVPPAAPLPCSLTAFPAYCSCSKVQVLHSFFLPSRILLLLLFFFYFLLRTTQFILFCSHTFFLLPFRRCSTLSCCCFYAASVWLPLRHLSAACTRTRTRSRPACHNYLHFTSSACG